MPRKNNRFWIALFLAFLASTGALTLPKPASVPVPPGAFDGDC